MAFSGFDGVSSDACYTAYGNGNASAYTQPDCESDVDAAPAIKQGKQMKLTWFAILAFSLLMLGMAVAQSPPATYQPQQKDLTASDLENQMEEVGCKAERQAAAQTIVQMKQQISALQKELAAAKDPPHGGATKH